MTRFRWRAPSADQAIYHFSHITMKEYKTEDPRWVSFYPKYNSGFYIEKAGYFDERPLIHTSVTQIIALLAIVPLALVSLWFLLLLPFALLFGWGMLFIHLPIRTGIQDCESATWGVNYHGSILWIYTGGGGNFDGGRKYVSIYMPWNYKWIRTSTRLADGTWHHETKGNLLRWGKTENEPGGYTWLNENKWTELHPYFDIDGELMDVTLSMKEYERRPRGFVWTSLFAKVRKFVEVEFSAESGPTKVTSKGGVTKTGYALLPNETPYDCFMRSIEQERRQAELNTYYND